jgi:peptidoglycan hydrolase-like protein with peptidoglycan-binding domain
MPARDERQWMRDIERIHLNQGWFGIGYNYGVGMSGTIYEGCGRDVRGVHSPPRNTDGWGVVFLQSSNAQGGNRGPLTPQAQTAARALYDWLGGVAGRRLEMWWHGRDFATMCPGPDVQAWVQAGMPAGGAGPVQPPTPGPGGAPPWPGRILRQPPLMRGDDVRIWQGAAGGLQVDGAYGPLSEGRCRAIQQAAGLSVDGRVGPNTWPATWRVGGGAPAPAPPPPPAGTVPFPGRLLRNTRPMMQGADVRQYQARMRERGWTIGVDGWFGPESERVTRQFQTNHRLAVDGIVGPITWGAAFGR